jgi:hypothetical protein
MTENRAWTLDEEKELAGKLRLAVKQVTEFKQLLQNLGYNVRIVASDPENKFSEVYITKTQEVVL